jgi:hypothetical protein
MDTMDITETNLLKQLSVYYVREAYYAILKRVMGHVETVKRLDRAFDIVTKDRGYVITLMSKNPVTFEINGPNGLYTVINSRQSCTCPDTDILCKHRLAVSLILQGLNLQKKGEVYV